MDISLVMYGSSIKYGYTHQERDLPMFIAGKAGTNLRTNRRVTSEKETPLCNFYLSLLHHMGVEAESFGDSTGALELFS